MGNTSPNRRPSLALKLHAAEVREVVSRYNGRNPRVFGSVLDETDRPDSDLDLLVDPTPSMTLFDLGRITNELQELLGVTVSVVTPAALPKKWRAEVLRMARPIHG